MSSSRAVPSLSSVHSNMSSVSPFKVLKDQEMQPFSWKQLQEQSTDVGSETVFKGVPTYRIPFSVHRPASDLQSLHPLEPAKPSPRMVFVAPDRSVHKDDDFK